MKRICYALRADAPRKPGGDSTKVSHYVEHLEQMGYRCTIALSVGEMEDQRPDIVHAFNVDLPYENYAYFRWARDRGIPFVFSPILHPVAGVRSFYEDGADRFNRVCSRAGLSVDRAYHLREALKAARNDWRNVIRTARLERAALRGSLLREVDALLPMCEGELQEARQLSDDQLAQATIVRNALSFLPDTHRTGGRGVAVVGRIEPRKNQVALLEAIRRQGIDEDFVFAGGINERHPAYARRFREEVSANPRVRWVDHIGRAEVRDLLSATDVHFSSSWYEVISQVDLEAAVMGSAVVVSGHSYAEDYFVGPLTRSSATGLDDVGLLLSQSRLSRDLLRVNLEMVRTWLDVSTDLSRVYQQLC